MLDLRTAKAYQIKLAPARFWEIADPAEAISYLKRWDFWATHSRLAPVIHAAMKRAYGFKQASYLKTVIYLVAGRLSFSYPQ